MDISAQLQEFGLSPRQIRVYLSCLELGTSNISQLAQKSGEKRTTIYPVIEQLIDLELIHAVPHGKRIRYTASEPGKLVKMYERKKELLEELIPELSALSSETSGKPRILFYEGKDSINKLHQLILDKYAQTTYRIIGDSRGFMKHVHNYKKFQTQRHQAGIQTKLLLYDTPEARTQTPKASGLGMEIHLLPKGAFFKAIFHIFDDAIHVFDTTSTIALRIESKFIANAQQHLFDLLWENTKTTE